MLSWLHYHGKDANGKAGPATRHIGHDGAAHALGWPGERIRNRARDRAAVRRRPRCGPRLSLPRASPLREERPSCRKMGDVLYEPSVSYTHLRAHETPEHLVCRLLLEK